MSLFAYLQFYAYLFFPLLLAAAAGYLLGSISFAILLTRAFTKEDVREHGSGNAGATNVMRVAGPAASGLTFLMDFIKCAISVAIGYLILRYMAGAEPELARVGMYAAGYFCMIGHMHPLYFGFRGGKGVVTAAAMMVLLDWRVFLIVFAVFLILFLWKRIISLGSIACAVVYPFVTFGITYGVDFLVGEAPLFSAILATLVALLMGVTVIWKHRANIGRLIRGEEKPISFKKEKN